MALSKQDREKLMVAGAALVSTGVVVGTVGWLIRRQMQQGDVLKVQLVHSADPKLTKQVDELTVVLREYLPQVTSLSESGLDMNMRLGNRT